MYCIWMKDRHPIIQSNRNCNMPCQNNLKKGKIFLSHHKTFFHIMIPSIYDPIFVQLEPYLINMSETSTACHMMIPFKYACVFFANRLFGVYAKTRRQSPFSALFWISGGRNPAFACQVLITSLINMFATKAGCQTNLNISSPRIVYPGSKQVLCKQMQNSGLDYSVFVSLSRELFLF